MRCPRCDIPMEVALEPTARGRVEVDYCRRCRGIWFDAQELADLLCIGNLEAFTAGSPLLTGASPSPLFCPRGHHSPMHERQMVSDGRGGRAVPLRIDQCSGCEGLWLDGEELKGVVGALGDRRIQPFLVDPERPTGVALWVFMLLTGLPIEQWHPRLRRPVAVTALIAACVLVFVWQITGDPDASVARYGLVPARLASGGYGALLSHMFLHGGLAHLLGNMYFLWVFGDNVEDHLGRGSFLGLFLLSGLGAALLHCGLTDDASVPVVGASGAISGVMAAYAVLFPRARLISLIVFFQVRWRSTTYLGMWLIFQVIGAALHTPGIAWWAHIGGFLAGGVLAWPLRGRR